MTHEIQTVVYKKDTIVYQDNCIVRTAIMVSRTTYTYKKKKNSKPKNNVGYRRPIANSTAICRRFRSLSTPAKRKGVKNIKSGDQTRKRHKP